jgi:hypothetical protein
MKLKAIGLLCLLVAAAPAQALTFDISAGQTTFNLQKNGYWYQKGLPYSADLESPTYQLGVTAEWSPWLDARAAYVDLGEASIDAIATPDDANYDRRGKRCIGECESLHRFQGHGRNSGILLALQPNIDVEGFNLFAGVGAYVYRATWHERITNVGGRYYTDRHPGCVFKFDREVYTRISYYYALGVSRGQVSLVYEVFGYLKEAGGGYDHAHSVSLRYAFGMVAP